jgi:hypothetical protein
MEVGGWRVNDWDLNRGGETLLVSDGPIPPVHRTPIPTRISNHPCKKTAPHPLQPIICRKKSNPVNKAVTFSRLNSLTADIHVQTGADLRI